MPGGRSLQTGRLVLTPVSAGDLPTLLRLKADPQVFAQMLGGVRQPNQVTAELAEDIGFWARHGTGMWMVREGDIVVGLTGLHERTDGRGIALRFAFTPESRGRGLAREAASAALRHGHDQGGIVRVVAAAKESNFSSRMVLGAVGMRECGTFERAGERVLLFESVAPAGGHRSGSANVA